MLRWLGFAVLVVVIVVAVNFMSSGERKESEQRYQATLVQYQTTLKPGTTRADVEKYLQKQNLAFDQGIPQPLSDRTKLGELPRGLFCQPWKVYLDFGFKSADPSASTPRDSDLLTAVDLHREGVCF
jgi:hypothetical protein